MTTQEVRESTGTAQQPDGTLPSVSALLDASLAYAARGWAVLPLHSIRDGRCTCGDPNCHARGKHPRTPHGTKDATIDEATIRQWWRLWPDANIGVATGAISNLVVIDVDPRHGGAESIEELERAHGKLPPTFTVTTGGGGTHLPFRNFGGKVPNSASKIAPGIDVRGEGGFVVAPPSVHASGKRYERVPGVIGVLKVV